MPHLHRKQKTTCITEWSLLEREHIFEIDTFDTKQRNSVDEMDDVLRFSTSRGTLLRSEGKKRSKSSLCFKKQRIPKTNRRADGNPIQPAVTLKAEELVTKDKAGEDDGRQCRKKEPTNQVGETSQSLPTCIEKVPRTKTQDFIQYTTLYS